MFAATATAKYFRCPGEQYDISRPVHLARLAAFYSKCRDCPHAPAGDGSALDKAAEGVDLGGPAGGTLATLFTAAAAVGTFLLAPGLFIAGPVAAALAGAGAAAVASGLVGALHDWGLPQDRIQGYEAALKAGGILLGVKPKTEEDAQLIERQWKAIGAERRHDI
jgi:hypothetical protein